MNRKLISLAVAAAAVLALNAGDATAAAEGPPPYRVEGFVTMSANETAWLLSGQNAARPANGVNVPGCRPSAAHPEPVILLHGLSGNQYNGWSYLGPSLANKGYCVYSLNYGGTAPDSFANGLAPIADSAQQVAKFIDTVRTQTGAAKVDLVGHSEGGFLVEYVPKAIPGASGKVGKVVALAPPTHGTDLFGVISIVDLLNLRDKISDTCGQACTDVMKDSPIVKELNTGPIAQPGIDYTTIISRYDEAITPNASAAINEPGVRNITVQDVCPWDRVGHVGLAFDAGVRTMVENALDPAHPAPVRCDLGLPF
ncbi:esterase/lipase family protein [Streptomyces boninensis]|uniref:esterase/lipase family protein n=1 Tax=Streptomyces boninensis TaxID=2039455 RepID=UPI003B227F83